jgi:hypothetical protein
MSEYLIYYSLNGDLKKMYTEASSPLEAKNNLNSLIDDTKLLNCLSIDDIENGLLTKEENK